MGRRSSPWRLALLQAEPYPARRGLKSSSLSTTPRTSAALLESTLARHGDLAAHPLRPKLDFKFTLLKDAQDALALGDSPRHWRLSTTGRDSAPQTCWTRSTTSTAARTWTRPTRTPVKIARPWVASSWRSRWTTRPSCQSRGFRGRSWTSSIRSAPASNVLPGRRREPQWSSDTWLLLHWRRRRRP